jgi:integrase
VELGPKGSLRPYTYSTLFGLLITTGLRISEALSLVFDDFTEDGLVIRNTKFKKSRLVPLHETASDGLAKYLCRRSRFASCDNHIFISLRGKVLDRSAVQWTFRRIFKTIELDPAPDGRRPRIHDLRHSYACRALEASPEGRENIGRHMRALSTYMGHTKIEDTFWYLEATLHLMQDIARQCESFFLKGGRQ